MSRPKSAALFEEAKKLFPGGVNSPVRAFKSVEGPPLFIKRGNGSRIYDEDGNEYLDFCGSWGPLILGHNNEKVREAISSTVANGTSFGTPTALGVEIGKLIVENHRYLEKIRFVCSGTEAVMSAIRLARGYTGKNKILKFEGCYHGHVDSLMVKAGSGLATFGESSSAGIPESLAKQTLVIPLNDLVALEEVLKTHHEDLACVIIEPVPANNGLLLQDSNYLVWLRKLCDDYGVLLIFDEVISGFRVGYEGASGYYHIEPDLITFGKIIGGGMPVGAYGGRADLMAHIAPDGPVYQAGTLSANPVTIAAGIATIKQLLEPGFYEEQAAKTSYMIDKILKYTSSANYPFTIQHIGSIFWLNFSDRRVFASDEIAEHSSDKFKILHSYLLENGIYLGPSSYEVGFVSAAHSYADLDLAVDKINKGLDLAFATT